MKQEKNTSLQLDFRKRRYILPKVVFLPYAYSIDKDEEAKLRNRIEAFNRHRISIEEIFGLCIECKRKGGYVYYIDNVEVLKGNSVQKWILDSFSVGNLLSGNLSLKNRILLENIPSGKIYLQTVIDAMRKGHKLRMNYRHFGKTEGYTLVVEPYAVKVFKQRWYLVVNNPKYNSYTVYAFDRIVSLEETSETFNVSENFEAEEVFKDSYGIICGTQTEVQRIRIRAYFPLGGLSSYFALAFFSKGIVLYF